MLGNKRCILIVDDEVKMVRALSDLFTANGFHVLKAYDGEEALEVFYSHNAEVDLVLLDVMMPKLDGFGTLENIRDNSSMVPVILLTAKGEEYDQVKGFRYGADDYIAKPFSPSLLIARTESILKRVGKSATNEINSGEIQINSVKRTATCGTHSLDLTKREFDLLLFLLSNPSIIFTRDQILSSVWGYDFDGDARTVDTHIKQLRLKLKDNSNCIKTIHRVGYKYEA